MSVLLCAGVAAAGGPVVPVPVRSAGFGLTDAELNERPIAVVGINAEGIIELSNAGERETLPFERAWMLVAARDGAMGSNPGQGTHMVELVDGQRLVVMIDDKTPDEMIGCLLWGEHELALPIERVRRVVRLDAEHMAEPGGVNDDLIVLSNGDHVSGFVESFGGGVVIDSAAPIPLERVAALYLANPPEVRPEAMLLLGDGSAVRVLSWFDADAGFVRAAINPAALAAAEPSEGNSNPIVMTWTLGQVRGLVLSRPDARLVALASIEPASITPTGGRRWVEPVRTEQGDAGAPGDVIVPSPAEVVYMLPRGSTRLACTIEPQRGLWSDRVVVFETENAEGERAALWSRRIGQGDDPPAINIELPEDALRLVVRVEPGEHGAIQDGVTLVRPRLLVRR